MTQKGRERERERGGGEVGAERQKDKHTGI